MTFSSIQYDPFATIKLLSFMLSFIKRLTFMYMVHVHRFTRMYHVAERKRKILAALKSENLTFLSSTRFIDINSCE